MKFIRAIHADVRLTPPPTIVLLCCRLFMWCRFDVGHAGRRRRGSAGGLRLGGIALGVVRRCRPSMIFSRLPSFETRRRPRARTGHTRRRGPRRSVSAIASSSASRIALPGFEPHPRQGPLLLRVRGGERQPVVRFGRDQGVEAVVVDVT